MFDRLRALDQLAHLEDACSRIVRRAAMVESPEAFLATEEGLTLLDAISMMIVVIGEEVKALDKHLPQEYFLEHAEVDWKAAKGMRDRISHDYFSLDELVVFRVAKEDIPLLLAAVRAMQIKLEGEDGPA
jgi:uncharacterized protein with HEPN domain